MKQYMRRHPVRAKAIAIAVSLLFVSTSTYLLVAKIGDGSASFLGILLGWQIVYLLIYALFALVQAIQGRSSILAVVAAVIICLLLSVVSLSYALGVRYDPEASPARESILLLAGAGNCSGWNNGNGNNLGTDYLCALMSVPENNRLLLEPDFLASVNGSHFDHEAAQSIAKSKTSYLITFTLTELLLLLSLYALIGLQMQQNSRTYPQKSKKL